MLIEDYWIDMRAFYVTFLTNENIKIKKMLFFTPQQIEHGGINEIIKKKFRHVDKVLSIEELDDGLTLK